MAKLIVLCLIASLAAGVHSQPGPDTKTAPGDLSNMLQRFRGGGSTGSYATAAATAGQGAFAESSASYNGAKHQIGGPRSPLSHSGAHAAAQAGAGLGAEIVDHHAPIESIEPIPKPEEPKIPHSEPGVAPPAPEKPKIDLSRFRNNNAATSLRSRFTNQSPHLLAKAYAAAGSNGFSKPVVSKFQTSHNKPAGGSGAFAQALAGAGVEQTKVNTDGQITEDETSIAYEEPEQIAEAAAASGTYVDDDGAVYETSGYERSTEDQEEDEDGEEDDNHQYKAHSHSKADDLSKREKYSKGDHEIEHTPTLYKSKKSHENYDYELQKRSRQSGSGVEARDSHKAKFAARKRRFNERVNQTRDRFGSGIEERSSANSSNGFDEEDEEIFDSDGFGNKSEVSLSANGSAKSGSSAKSSASISKH